MIGTNIRNLRLAAAMEQSELADRLHISNKTISSWECGRTEPKMGMIEAMCKVFGCQKTELIDGKRDDNSVSPAEMDFIRLLRNADSDTQQVIHRLLLLQAMNKNKK